LLVIGVSGVAMADGGLAVPEISAGSAASAVALLSGGLLVLRARRKP
jgi:hypothetical protein